MKSIHQLVAGFSKGDAISNEALVMRSIFRSWGFLSEIYAETRRVLPELRKDARDLRNLANDLKPDDIALLHLSIGADANDLFPELPCRKVILYHNITPPQYFRGIQEEIAHLLARGRDQLTRLAGVAEVVMADSPYNAEELTTLGYGDVSVLPLVLDLEKVRARPDRRAMAAWSDGMKNILFVGRCVPNKRIEDVITAFHYYQRAVEPDARLILAGSYSGVEAYQAYQLTLIRELKTDNVVFTGSITQAELNACYRSAHVFLCMSEHEGFCIPIIEAMALDVPVLAYAAAAVPGTMDGAGVLFHEKKWEAIAEMMHQLAEDTLLRRRVLAGQQQRIQRYETRRLDQELRQRLQPLL
jgi:L-malate glycosyltransferase